MVRRARWRLRLIIVDFEIIHPQSLYLQAADPIAGLPEEGNNSLRDEKDFDDDIPTNFIEWEQFAVCSKIDDGLSTALAMQRSKNIFDSRQTDAYCEKMKTLVQGSNLRFIRDENGLVFWNASLVCFFTTHRVGGSPPSSTLQCASFRHRWKSR